MKIKDDPAIEQIREVRHRISAEFGHDTNRLIDHYRELEKKYADRLVKPTVRKPDPAEVATQ